MYASTAAILGGFEHELPIVVYSCVEELYRGEPQYSLTTPSVNF